jgi:hypothetical protein
MRNPIGVGACVRARVYACLLDVLLQIQSQEGIIIYIYIYMYICQRQQKDFGVLDGCCLSSQNIMRARTYIQIPRKRA